MRRRIVVSDLTLLELRSAPERVRSLLETVPESFVERVAVADETRQLADAYVAARVVGLSMLADAQHIAVATVHRTDVLVSWNFKHIVNLRRIHGFNSINLRRGYPLLEIRNPREVLTYDED